ncbi:hypothetical protein PGTUg99_019099 [Puccinia graminis f. sp. tritici]|uniref:Uncharacterized protein n=1 Tax=Puccinia graminis f. sp. tritici TaxID=56615 RepID=A0A5B0SAT9_PUCGR|nr:hypothetical protein PGTUg99_019099 [Puccinia graminis f. sp. tritici]
MSVCCFEALRTSSSFHSIPLQLLSKLTAPSDEVRWIHPHLHCMYYYNTSTGTYNNIHHLPAPVEDVSGALSASVCDRLQKAFEDARPSQPRPSILQEIASVCDRKTTASSWAEIQECNDVRRDVTLICKGCSLGKSNQVDDPKDR